MSVISTWCARMISSLWSFKQQTITTINNNKQPQPQTPTNNSNKQQQQTTSTPISWPIRWSSSIINSDTSWMCLWCFHLLESMSQCSGVEIITLPYKEERHRDIPLPVNHMISHTVLSKVKSVLVSPVNKTTFLPSSLPKLFSQSLYLYKQREVPQIPNLCNYDLSPLTVVTNLFCQRRVRSDVNSFSSFRHIRE